MSFQKKTLQLSPPISSHFPYLSPFCQVLYAKTLDFRDFEATFKHTELLENFYETA